MALRYHPDQNAGNDWAAAFFRDLKQAYETLIDPVRRQAYDMQLGNGKMHRLPTAAYVVADLEALHNQIIKSNLFHINRDLLNHRVQVYLDPRFYRLLEADLPQWNPLVQAMLTLGPYMGHTHYKSILYKLLDSPAPEDTKRMVSQALVQLRRQMRWALWWPWLLVMAVLLMCLLMAAVL